MDSQHYVKEKERPTLAVGRFIRPSHHGLCHERRQGFVAYALKDGLRITPLGTANSQLPGADNICSGYRRSLGRRFHEISRSRAIPKAILPY